MCRLLSLTYAAACYSLQQLPQHLSLVIRRTVAKRNMQLQKGDLWSNSSGLGVFLPKLTVGRLQGLLLPLGGIGWAVSAEVLGDNCIVLSSCIVSMDCIGSHYIHQSRIFCLLLTIFRFNFCMDICRQFSPLRLDA